MSVLGFCERAEGLLLADQGKFVRFVLTGQDGNSQGCIDPIINRTSEDDVLRASRDYDSLLGISKHIEVDQHLTVYPVARHEDTLSRNIHIKHEFTTANVSFLVPMFEANLS